MVQYETGLQVLEEEIEQLKSRFKALKVRSKE